MARSRGTESRDRLLELSSDTGGEADLHSKCAMLNAAGKAALRMRNRKNITAAEHSAYVNRPLATLSSGRTGRQRRTKAVQAARHKTRRVALLQQAGSQKPIIPIPA